jgi:DNA-binding CsgD family transcriptional regulator
VRGTESFFHFINGQARAYPKIIGLGDAIVTSDHSSHRGRFSITFSRPSQIETRLQCVVDGMVSAMRRTWESDANWAVMTAFRGPSPQDVQVANETFQSLRTLDELGETLFDFLAREYCATGLIIDYESGGELQRHALGNRLPGGYTERVLMAGSQRVGRLRSDAPVRVDGFDPPRLQAALPVIGNLIQRLTSAQKPVQVYDLLQPNIEHWNLKDRPRQVLSLLLEGRSNKEIAASLDCSIRAVEEHVRKLLILGGAKSRGELVARLLHGVDSKPS